MSAIPVEVSVERQVALVADDDDDIRSLVRTFLERERYTVVEARDGAEALRQAAENAPTLAVIDVHMPGINGFQLTRQLRKRVATNPVIVMLSARATEEDVLMALVAGADDYVSKPFSGAILRLRIRDLLSLRAHARTSPV